MSLIITSRNVVLPAHHEACPATIHVDLASGKISRVQLLHGSKSDCPNDATFIDYGDLYILPGLVECVRIDCPSCMSLLLRAVPMSTSTSLGAPIGRVSQQEPRQPLLVALLWSLTCPSIPFL